MEHPSTQADRLAEPPPERIAVLRALQLGDLLCAVPALRALRRRFPRAEITLVGLAWARTFAERFGDYLDRFLELPGYPGLPEVPARVAEIPVFLERAQAQRFDLALQLHGSGVVTNPLTVLLGARATAGFFLPGHFCPDEERFLALPEDEPEVRRPLRLLEFLGVPLAGEELEFPLRDSDREELAALEPARGLRSDYACVHPGARFAHRRWPAARFAAVADALAASGLRVVLTGSDEEEGLAREVAGHMRAEPLVLAGRTSLGALAALLDGARLLVCNDTGVSHMAAALRLPSVVVVTTSDPARWAPLDRDLHRVVRRPSGPEGVLTEARVLLERRRPRAA